MERDSIAGNTGLTVADVLGKLRAAAGSAWQDAPWDGLQVGDPTAHVTGIAVAWSPAIDVLRKTAAQGCNLLLVKDPIYWSEHDAPGTDAERTPDRITEGSAGGTPWATVEATSLYRYKEDLIERSGLNIVRVAQNWDGDRANALRGLLKALDWKEGQTFVADDRAPHSKSSVVKAPPQTLLQLAEYAKAHLGAKSVRVLGDRNARVSTVAVHPAYITVKAATRLGIVPNLDVVLSGEGCEWESFEYFEDWIDAGHGKGLIMLGLAVTSDSAAREFASWVQGVMGSIKVAFLPIGDPFTPSMQERSAYELPNQRPQDHPPRFHHQRRLRCRRHYLPRLRSCPDAHAHDCRAGCRSDQEKPQHALGQQDLPRHLQSRRPEYAGQGRRHLLHEHLGRPEARATPGLNFVITHEPTFWSDADSVEPIKTDPLYLEKLHFIEQHGMVVFRIHDHWHRVSPEPMGAANKQALGWPVDPPTPLVQGPANSAAGSRRARREGALLA